MGRIDLGDITPHNIKQLKKLNSVVFPVSYNDKVCSCETLLLIFKFVVSTRGSFLSISPCKRQHQSLRRAKLSLPSFLSNAEGKL